MMATAYLEFVEADGKKVYRSQTGTRLISRPVDFITRKALYRAHRAWVEDHGDVMLVKDRSGGNGHVDPKEFFIIKLKARPL